MQEKLGGAEPVRPPAPARDAAPTERRSAKDAEPSARAFRDHSIFHAQIGHDVDRAAVREMSAALAEQARAKFFEADYGGALELYGQCLAIAERGAEPPDVRGATVHNIGSCLHYLGDLHGAKSHYERAQRIFAAEPAPGALSRWWYGDTNRLRHDFIKERLVDVQWGRLPGSNAYVDAGGNRHHRPDPATFAAERAADAAARAALDAAHGPPGSRYAAASVYGLSDLYGLTGACACGMGGGACRGDDVADETQTQALRAAGGGGSDSRPSEWPGHVDEPRRLPHEAADDGASVAFATGLRVILSPAKK